MSAWNLLEYIPAYNILVSAYQEAPNITKARASFL
jgi:hypothetical protein